MWLGETKEWDPNRHSALWRISTARMCCHYMSNPHLRQRRLPSGPSLQLNRLRWRGGARQSLCTVWLHSFAVFISQWQTLFICDSTRFLWPQCPNSTSHPPPTTPNFFISGHRRQKLEIVSFSHCELPFFNARVCSSSLNSTISLLVDEIHNDLLNVAFYNRITHWLLWFCLSPNKQLLSLLLKTCDRFPFISHSLATLLDSHSKEDVVSL